MRFLGVVLTLLWLALPAQAQQAGDGAPNPNLVASLSLSENGPALAGVAADAYWRLVPLEDVGGGALPGAGSGATYSVRAPAGMYRIDVRLGAVSVEQDVLLKKAEKTDLRIVLDAGIVEVIPKRVESDPAADETIRVELRGVNGARDRGTGAGTYVMPAGVIDITARLGKAEGQDRFDLYAGDRIQREVALNVATVIGRVLLSTGGEAIETGDAKVAIQTEDGATRRGAVNKTYGVRPMLVSAGRYVMKAQVGKAEAQSQAFELEPGEDRMVDIILEAGRLEVNAPGAYRISVRGATGEEQSGRELARGRGPDFAEVLPVGSYLLSLTYADGGAAERPFSISAGEDTRLVIPAP
jgi:Ca-activated chloride channel family protein